MALTGVRERLDIGRVTSMTFTLIRGRFLALVAISFAFSLPAEVVRIAALRFYPAQATTGITLGSLILFLLLWISVTIAGAVLQGAVTPLADSHFHDGRTSTTAAVAAALRKALLLAALGSIFGVGVALGLFVLIVPGLLLAVRWCVAAPAMAGEQLGIREALARSRTLTEGNRWGVLVLIVFKYAAAFAIIFVVQMVRMTLAPMSFAPLLSQSLDLVILSSGAMISTAGAAALHVELRRIQDGVGYARVGEIFD